MNRPATVLFSLCLISAPNATSHTRKSPAASAPSGDPSQWTGEQVYQILNKSPWTETVKMRLSAGDSLMNNQGPNIGSNGNSTRNMPMSGGGISRRGGRSSTYSSGNGTPPPTSNQGGSTEIKVQWQSAEVVRLAAARKAEQPLDPATVKPADQYVVGVIGLPITAVGGRSASADSDSTLGADLEKQIEARVRSAASIVVPGHEALTPVKVELDQGADGRMLIYFPRAHPIEESDRSVEFRLRLGKAELKKKFLLKDMEYQGKLDL